MKNILSTHVVTLALGALTLPFLAGCDAGKEPFLKASAAEESGDYKGAATLYQEVCAKKSPLCNMAKKREARLAIKAAWKAYEAGNYKEAKSIADAAATSADLVTAEGAKAILGNADLLLGVAFEEAVGMADKAAQLKAMEGIAKEATVVSPKAKEWLDKNRPGLLLAEAKAACVPKGAGSCAAAAKRLASSHPDSPEAKEAAGLAAENYKRLYPKIKDVENLLIQRVSVYEKAAKIEACKKFGGTDETCAEAVTVQAPGLDYLEGFYKQRLELVEDPYFKEHFEKRWGLAAGGQYDAEPWPKP